MNQALGITIGSSIQISLFVTPFLVILGWFMDKPMSLGKSYLFSFLTRRFSALPGGDNIFVCHSDGVSDSGWENDLDERCIVVGPVRCYWN
jgi:hypothetical protein